MASKVLPYVALVLVIALATMSFMAARSAAEQAEATRQIAERRSEILDELALQSSQRNCFARLQSEFDLSITQGLLSEEGSPEREAAIQRLAAIGQRLADVEAICFGENPDSTPLSRDE